ncbi:MAG TPA: class I SAM-dependent methyltransferase [Acidimicrobiales bacterium]|nr:class I SAM-dependent methyltransferase [Acidimicrobiales bacterium]
MEVGGGGRVVAAPAVVLPKELLDRLAGMGVGRSGQRVLDLGTGTGSLARAFAHRGCRVTGLDVAESHLRRAQALDRAEGVFVEYVVGRAEDLEGPDARVDAVVAGNSWHRFDTEAVAAECHRVLVPGGALALCHVGRLFLPGGVVSATESLMVEYSPGSSIGDGLGMYPAWATPVAGAGFVGIETFSFDVDVLFRHQDWRALVQATDAVAGTLPADAAAAFDEELGALLDVAFPADPLVVPHRVWALVARRGQRTG